MFLIIVICLCCVVRARMHACMHACVRACVCACVCMCARVRCVHARVLALCVCACVGCVCACVQCVCAHAPCERTCLRVVRVHVVRVFCFVLLLFLNYNSHTIDEGKSTTTR